MQVYLKYLAFVAYIALCVAVGIIITLISPKQCISRKCMQKNNLVLQDMDISVRPCDNFYQYICGNYVGLDEKRGKSVTEAIQTKQISLLSSYLDLPSKKSDNRVLRIIKAVYQSCLDTEHIEEEGVQPITDRIRLLGGFPLVEGKSWNTLITDRPWSLDVGEYKARYAGFRGGIIFESTVQRYEQDDSYYVHIKPPGNLNFTDAVFKAYHTYIKNITSILCTFNKKYFTPEEKEIEDTVQFMKELFKIERQKVGCKDMFRLEELEDFSKEFPFLGLKNYLNQMLPYVKLPKNIVVTTESKAFFTKVKDIIAKTDKRIVCNCMMIFNILQVTPLLPSSFRHAKYVLLKTSNVPHTLIGSDRRSLCTKLITESLSSAVTALYLRDVFQYKKEQRYFSFLLATLKSHMVKLIRHVQWMDKDTKEKAVFKVDLMGFAYPVPDGEYEELTNQTAFRIYYEDLCFIRNTSTLSSYLALPQFSSDRNWDLLGKHTDVFDKNIDIFSSDIYYDFHRNTVVIPMEFKNYPTFNGRWPKYLNYGGLCSKIAMELFRGISFSGSSFGILGKKNNWWTVETKAEYKRRNRCFVNQYNNYIKSFTDTEIRDPECIEDIEIRLAGVKIAYLTYSTIERERFFPERRLTGLKHFSPKQMFFVDFATYYCDVNWLPPQGRNLTEREASEEPNEYKVIGSLRNMKLFSDIFECSPNDAMNPSGKCDMWNS
uniref:Peptidase M13 N-terminal domain-containing protein n=1 Tax=Cuerna arida TaxID=1464854 RepID=A0A1B6GFT8_9HEMI